MGATRQPRRAFLGVLAVALLAPPLGARALASPAVGAGAAAAVTAAVADVATDADAAIGARVVSDADATTEPAGKTEAAPREAEPETQAEAEPAREEPTPPDTPGTIAEGVPDGEAERSPRAAPSPAATVPSPSDPAAAGDAPRPAVVAVELRVDGEAERVEELVDLVAIPLGKPLSDEAVRQTLRNLYASGVAAEIEIWAWPEAAGERVAIALWTNVVVRRVAVDGETGLRRAQLEAAVVQRAGEPLVEDRVLRSVYRLQDLLREHGYLEAQVRLAVDTDLAARRADVVFRVRSGPRARVASVGFDGDLAPFAPADLLREIATRPGALFRADTARSDADRLRAWLVEERFRLAEVEPPRETYDEERDEVTLLYPIQVGPRVAVEVHGAALDELRRRDLLPFLGAEGYDEALVLQAVERIRRHYQERGRHQVQVRWREERGDRALKLVLEIEPGPELAVEEVRFRGNQEVDDATLRDLMATAPRRLLVPGSGRLVDETLRADLDNIRSYYALRGYRGTEVGPSAVELRGDRLVVSVPIVEGERRRVVDVRVAGAAAFTPEQLLEGLPIRRNGPFHPRLLEDSIALLRARYDDHGYDEAQVEARLDWSADRTLVDVEFDILEGVQKVVDRVVLRGNTETDSDVIRRAVELRPGTPLSTRRLLEVQRSLYQLGIFSRVEVSLAPGNPFAGNRDVVVRVEEGRNRRLSTGLGYDSDDGVRGLLGLAHRNLFGKALTLQFEGRASERDQQGRLLFRQPTLFRWPLPITYSIYRQHEESDRFAGDIRGTQLEATRTYLHRRLSLLYNYRVVDGEGSDLRELQDIAISSLTPTLLFDHRDDALDPTRGWSSALQLEYAFPWFAADAEFLKAFVQQTYYLNLRGGGVLGGSLRLGGIEDLSALELAPTVPGQLPPSAVPIVERFFAGGRSTHRAYDRDALGIPGRTLQDGTPVGGNGLVLFNLDWRFPIAGALGGVVFADSGNVWRDWRDLDAGDLEAGVGVGVRYLSPIGPLRAEIGWKLDRERGESPYEIHLSFGNPF